MEYSEVINKTKSWISVIQKSVIFLAIVEAIIVLVIGVASSNIYHETYATFWLYILIILGIIYLAIIIIKIAYNSKFPASIIDELEAKHSLEKVKMSVERKDTINRYIADTISRLSDYECTWDLPQIENNYKTMFYDDVHKGLLNLTEVFNQVLNILIDTSDYKFTSGVYISSYRVYNSELDTHFEKGVFIFRDDLNLNKNSELNKLINKTKFKDIQLEIQNSITSSFNNANQKITTINNNSSLIICSNIQKNGNSTSQKGVLFIIMEKIEDLPDDLESVLRVFTNIISHWLEMYDYKTTQKGIELFVRSKSD